VPGFLNLIVFGSILAFSAYIWLLRVSTYAYVNPVVAVLLGWAFATRASRGASGTACDSLSLPPL
jgi:drug/metabolite transporter (DMT)-like permease